jgi:hypothetical protein
VNTSIQHSSYLSDTGSNNAYANLGNQLDRNLSMRLGILQVVDELRKILDRINVVMRRR